MRQELFKIVDVQFLDSLLDGNLYMNTLNYFRKIEGNAAQQDPLEGACGTIPKGQLRQFGYHFDQKILDAMRERVVLLSDSYGFHNVFCLYQLLVDDENKTVQKPSARLKEFNEGGAPSKMVVWIKDRQAFLARVERAVRRAVTEHSLEYGIVGSVAYTNPWINADGPSSLCAFHKESSYAYQQEWRLCILRYGWEDVPLSFAVGSLRDIVEVVPLEQFLEHPETLFPGCSCQADLPPAPEEPYSIWGELNAASHLMHSYMPRPLFKPQLSDQAQADWHYARYLELTGQNDAVPAFLEKALERTKDLDHLDLLVNYQMSQNQWEKAADAYGLFLNEAPEQVKKDPVRVFFPLHQILMKQRQVGLAARIFLQAEEEYELPDDLKDIMRSDVLLGLGFFDQAAAVYERMKKTLADPILEYDLGVCRFFLLEFEAAKQSLGRFKRFFSVSAETAHRAEELDKLVDSFLLHQPFAQKSEENPFQGLEWTEKTEQMLKQAKGQWLYLSIDALYQLETGGKWELLGAVGQAVVTPQTIVRLVGLYQNTGNPIFYGIIDKLAGLDNVSIRSPKIQYYLAAEELCPELPPHYLAERGLMAELMQEAKGSAQGTEGQNPAKAPL